MTLRSITLMTILAAATIVADGCDSSLAAPSQDCAGLATAPPSARVDLVQPSFSNPTSVTNPLFPVSGLGRVIMMGSIGGVPIRVETTLLPGTTTIDLDGGPVETLTSQYVIWFDRRIHEVALDWYGQDDAGAVWYFGEDVFNYEGGVIVDTDGTWVAGRDGLPGMIMSATPQVGQVWRPENICDLVFEEVTVATTGATVAGPRGPVQGAIVIDELHMDNTHEDKTFAPGYGEFSTGSGADLEAVALAVPTDALGGPVPVQLTTLSAGADTVFDAAQVGDFATATAVLGRMNTAWTAFQAGNPPPMIRTRMNDALAALGSAIGAANRAATRQAAIDVDQASLDFQLRHRPITDIDYQLLELWARQLQVDAGAGDNDGVLSDAASLKWIRERLAPDVSFEPVELQLRNIQAAVVARNLNAASAAAVGLRTALGRR